MSLAGAWCCQVDSNHRQRDYESRALPPELRHRTGRAPRRAPRRRRSYLAVCARAFSLRFFVRRLASATRFLLFKLSPENERSRIATGSVIGSRFVEARFAFASTLYSLADRQLPVPGEGGLGGCQGEEPRADLVVERVFDAILLHCGVRAAPRLRPQILGVGRVAAELERNQVVFLVVGKVGVGG